ncbi:MAG: polysaccharide deacetylase family protein [Acidobacteriota bacterium]|nr:polysaccharide deacetylase family protein [Acidobacteriota bacterium]
MGFKRIIARAISEGWAAGRNLLGPRPGFRILLYHSVGTRLTHDTYGISIEPSLFKRHMQLLSESPGITIGSLFDTRVAGSDLRVAVTFDDGYKDNLYTAAPILLKFQIPFTVFVTTSFMQNESRDYLTERELRDLASLPGVNIGSHGTTHSPLAHCDELALWLELHESRCRIEDVIGRQVKTIAYPHGSVNQRVRYAAERAGYDVGVCSRFGINDENRDPLLLCRSEVLASDSERVFRQKISGAWDWYRWRSRDPLFL